MWDSVFTFPALSPAHSWFSHTHTHTHTCTHTTLPWTFCFLFPSPVSSLFMIHRHTHTHPATHPHTHTHYSTWDFLYSLSQPSLQLTHDSLTHIHWSWENHVCVYVQDFMWFCWHSYFTKQDTFILTNCYYYSPILSLPTSFQSKFVSLRLLIAFTFI